MPPAAFCAAFPMSQTAPRRSFFRRFLWLGVACVALLLVLVALLPSLVGGTVARTIETEYAARFAGRIEVAEVSLSWLSRQRIERVTLSTPEGERVATVAIELPSLLDLTGAASGAIGQVRVELEAALSAGADGTTNLDRALQPKAQPEPIVSEPAPEPTAEPFDVAAFLRSLDLEFVLVAPRLSWADAMTRQSGQPFELRQVELTATAKPGAPLVVRATGTVSADQPGELQLTATVHDLLQSKTQPFRSADVSLSVKNFSAGFVDAVALQKGNLAAQLGERLDLSLVVQDATLASGTVHVVLTSPKTAFELHAKLADGVIQEAQAPFLRLATPTPRGYLSKYMDEYLRPVLPTGAQLQVESSERPWTVEIARARIPWPSTTYEGLDLAVDAALPLRVNYLEPTLLAQGLTPALVDPSLSVRVEPTTGLVARVETQFAAGSTGRVSVDVAAREPLQVLSGAVPLADATVRVSGLPVAAADAITGQQGRLTRMVGATGDLEIAVRQANLTQGNATLQLTTPRVNLAAQARLADGVLRMGGADGSLVLRWTPGRELLQAELAALVPQGMEVAPLDGEVMVSVTQAQVPLADPLAAQAQFSLQMPGVRWSDEALRAESLAVAVTRPRFEAGVEADGVLRARFEAGLETGSVGRIALDTQVRSWKGLLDGQEAPIAVTLVVSDVATPLIEVLAGARGRVAPHVGPTLTTTLKVEQLLLAQAQPKSGQLQLGLEGQSASVAVSLALADGAVRGAAEEAVRVHVRSPATALQAELAAYLPSGTTLSFPAGGVETHLRVRELQCPLPPLAELGATALDKLLAPLAAQLQLSLGGVGYSDSTLEGFGVTDAELRSMDLRVQVKPNSAWDAQLQLGLKAVEAFDMSLQAQVAQPLELLSGRLPALELALRCPSLPGKLVDRVAAQEGLWADTVGADAQLVAEARVSGLGTPQMAVTSKVALRSALTTLALDVGLKDGIVTAEQAVDLSMKLDAARWKTRLAAYLPAGQNLELSAGSELSLRATQVSLVLPKEGLDLWKALGQSKVLLNVRLPDMQWSDAALQAAGRSVRLRGLTLETGLVPGQLAAVAFNGEVVDEPAGVLQARVGLLDPLTVLAQPDGWKTARLSLRVELQRLPTALLDVLAAQDGLLVEALGPRVDVGVQSAGLSLASGAFEAQLRSNQHSVVAYCRFEDAKLVVDRLDGVVAQVGLGPLVSQRVVGKLVPTLVQIKKAEGAAPVALHVDTLTMPFDANLRNLDAKVRLELGEVQYALLPGLDALFGDGGLKTSALPTIEVQIVKGVARYDRLPVRIGGKEHNFSGSYDLVDGQMKLTAGIPLAALGKKFNKELESVRDLVPPETVVPIELSGTWSSPKVRIGKKFLDELLERAAGKALEDLFGGKKKP